MNEKSITFRLSLAAFLLAYGVSAFGQPIKMAEEVTITSGNRTALVPELDSDRYIHCRWVPATNISDSTAIRPVVWPDTTTTYTLTAYRAGNKNLVANGDFERKGLFFRSDYQYVEPTENALFPEGVYTMATDAANQHVHFKPHSDHTHGDGKGRYMAVNGKMDPGAAVWEQEISGIDTHADFIFSAWFVTLKADLFTGRAVLQFSVNDSLVGEPFFAPFPDERAWAQFRTVWNSGEATSAVIKILNLNTDADGNDFGIDDISFLPVIPDTKEITVKVIRNK